MSRGEATRRRILDATGSVLTSRPGLVPSMSDIATAAGVTRQLLYFHFDSRSALLIELSRLIDVEARTPQLQATIDTAPDAVAALRTAVQVQATIKPKLYGVATGLDLLRPVDDGAAAACREREEARLGRCRAVVDRLAAEGRLAPDWTPESAAELLWSMTSMRTWEDLVHRAGWTGAEWAQRTTAALEAALVESQGAGSPTTRSMSAPSEPRF